MTKDPTNKIIEEKRANLWKDFITEIHIFCGREDKIDTSDLKYIFNRVLKAQRKEIVREIGKGIGRERILAKPPATTLVRMKIDVYNQALTDIKTLLKKYK